MMIRMLACFLVILVAMTSLAFAQNNTALCEFLPVKEHFVGADYVPGVDVHGNAVVPADVKARSNEFVDVIRIPITADIAENLAVGLALPDNVEMDAQLGMVEIQKDSRVLVNGKDLTKEVYTYCGKEPFDIHAASAAPETIPATPAVPETKPEQKEPEDIIWGEGY